MKPVQPRQNTGRGEAPAPSVLDILFNGVRPPGPSTRSAGALILDFARTLTLGTAFDMDAARLPPSPELPLRKVPGQDRVHPGPRKANPSNRARQQRDLMARINWGREIENQIFWFRARKPEHQERILEAVGQKIMALNRELDTFYWNPDPPVSQYTPPLGSGPRPLAEPKASAQRVTPTPPARPKEKPQVTPNPPPDARRATPGPPPRPAPKPKAKPGRR